MQLNRSWRRAAWVISLVAIALLVSACTAGPGSTAAGDREGSPASGAEGEGLLGEIKTAGAIRVANTQANPPFSFLDESNDVVGYDVDVANEIARRLGIREVEFVRGTFQTFIAGLETDKWDAVIAGLTPTDERRQQIDFTCPYQVNGVSIFVNQSNTTISGQADLQGQRIAVSAGSTQEQEAQRIPGARVLTYETATLALSDVSFGRADAYLGSRAVGSYLAEENDLAVKALPGLLNSEANAIAVPKGETALMAAMNEALSAMVSDGTLSAISARWFGGLDMAEELANLADC
ncbi:MAG: transporter substrate-binding domain-containing protein [Egibacteraceae bacterium]